MSGPKTLTIGITVNLEHYENLRLELNGEVQDEEGARELARFLYDVLGTYGRGDPATAERIDQFRRRVLPLAGEHAGPMKAPSPAETPPAPEAAAGKPPDVQTAVALPTTPAPANGKAGAVAGVLVCEECGATVGQAEQKMSMLFASKVLCRKCLKKV